MSIPREVKMSKKIEDSLVAKEIKIEYLKEHLNEVKSLINTWIGELNAPSPLGRDKKLSSWGWQLTYKPSAEQDQDQNHMLRRHLRSRTLWNHHANWDRKQESVWNLTIQIRDDASKKHMQQPLNREKHYTEDYLNTALWQGFDIACGRTIKLSYQTREGYEGLSFGAYVIKTSITSIEDRTLVEKDHRNFSYEIAQTDKMKELASLWSDIEKLQEAVRAIATKTLKSNDILYPCRFCKHLWK